jgi:hypothetical protein
MGEQPTEKPCDPETEEEAERKGSLLSEKEKIGLGILFSFFKAFLPEEGTPAQTMDAFGLPPLSGPTPQRRRGRSAPPVEELRRKVRELLRRGFTEFRLRKSKGKNCIYAWKKDEKTGKWIDAYVGLDSTALREILRSFKKKVSE